MRLRRPEDFRAVWSRGRSWAHPLFILWALSNTQGPARVGITASRKVGNAVARNRSRRLLREAARQLYPEMLEGWDIVLVARPRILGASEGEVEVGLRSMLGRAQLLRPTSSGCDGRVPFYANVLSVHLRGSLALWCRQRGMVGNQAYRTV
jgi:ribonuclease P protein component